jgi:hypothetical protein
MSPKHAGGKPKAKAKGKCTKNSADRAKIAQSKFIGAMKYKAKNAKNDVDKASATDALERYKNLKAGKKSEFALIFEDKGVREGLEWLNKYFEKTEDVDEALSNSVEDNFTLLLDSCI